MPPARTDALKENKLFRNTCVVSFKIIGGLPRRQRVKGDRYDNEAADTTPLQPLPLDRSVPGSYL